MLFDAIDKNRQLILDAERFIWKNPETGYKENKTQAYLAEKFKSLGYEIEYADNITGFYTWIDTGKAGANILILAELDSVICASHPESDKNTGAVHACGHNAQCATLLGIAAALKEPEILDKFSGRIMLCAVPAEELLEIDFRSKLIEEGKIKYLGGKSEFLRRGYFDDVDLSFMVHIDTKNCITIDKGWIGFISKKIVYKGKAAHAGGNPWMGQNALYAATCGVNAVNAIRETFKDSDVIRVHPIITRGGSMVNAIPDQAVLESYVRGKTFLAIENANKKINQALIGAALSIGTNIEIIDMPGYAPLLNSPELIKVAKEAVQKAIPDIDVVVNQDVSSLSSDMGDLSMIMPVLQPFIGGATGNAHGSDYFIINPERACIDNAKFQMALLYTLCENNGEKALRIKKEYQPTFQTKEEYFDYIDGITCSGDRIDYQKAHEVHVKL